MTTKKTEIGDEQILDMWFEEMKIKDPNVGFVHRRHGRDITSALLAPAYKPVSEKNVRMLDLVLTATPEEFYHFSVDPFELYSKRHHACNTHHVEHFVQSCDPTVGRDSMSLNDIREMVVDHVTSATRLPGVVTWKDALKEVRRWPSKFDEGSYSANEYARELAWVEHKLKGRCGRIKKSRADSRAPMCIRRMRRDYYRLMKEKGLSLPLRDFLMIAVNTPSMDELLKDLIESSPRWRGSFQEIKRHISAVHHNLNFFYPCQTWTKLHDYDKLYTSQYSAYLFKWYFGYKPDVVRRVVAPESSSEVEVVATETSDLEWDYSDCVAEHQETMWNMFSNVGGILSSVRETADNSAEVTREVARELPQMVASTSKTMSNVEELSGTLNGLFKEPKKLVDLTGKIVGSTVTGVAATLVAVATEVLKNPKFYRRVVPLIIALFATSGKVAVMALVYALCEVLGIVDKALDVLVTVWQDIMQSQQQQISAAGGGDECVEPEDAYQFPEDEYIIPEDDYEFCPEPLMAEHQETMGFDPVTIAGGVVTTLFVAFTGSIPKGGDTAEIMAQLAKKGFDFQKLHSGARALNALYESVTTLISGTVEWLIMKFCPSLASYTMIDTLLEGYLEWAESINTFTDGMYEVNMPKEKKLLQAVVAAHLKGTKFLNQCIAEPKLNRFITVTTGLMRQLDPVKRAAIQCLQGMDVKERNPILYLCGGPGVGKTKVTTILAEETVEFRGKEFGEFSENPIYPLNGALKHCDRYHQGTIVVTISDYAQFLGVESAATTFLMAAADETHYIMPMAAVEDKGMLYDGKAVIVNSNVAWPVFNKPYAMSDPAALWRRFDIHLEAVLQPGFEIDGTKQLDIQKLVTYLDANPNMTWRDCPHLRFTQRQSKKIVAQNLTLGEVRKLWEEKQKEYRKLHIMTTTKTAVPGKLVSLKNTLPSVVEWSTVFNINGENLTLGMLWVNARIHSIRLTAMGQGVTPRHIDGLGDLDPDFEADTMDPYIKDDAVFLENCFDVWENFDSERVRKLPFSWLSKAQRVMEKVKAEMLEAVKVFLEAHPTLAKVVGCLLAAAGIFTVFKLCKTLMTNSPSLGGSESAVSAVLPSSGEHGQAKKRDAVYPSSGEQDQRGDTFYPSSGEKGQNKRRDAVYPSSGELQECGCKECESALMDHPRSHKVAVGLMVPYSPGCMVAKKIVKKIRERHAESAIVNTPDSTGRRFVKPTFTVSRPEHAVAYQNETQECSLRVKKHVVRKRRRISETQSIALSAVNHVVREVIAESADDDVIASHSLLGTVAADWNAREFIRNRARRSMTPFVVECALGTSTSVGFRVQGRFMLVPFHSLRMVIEHPDSVCRIRSGDRWVEVKISKYHRFAGKDLALVLLPVTVAAAPSILSHFQRNSDLGKVDSTPAILISLPPHSILEEPNQVSYHDNLCAKHVTQYDYTINGDPRCITKGWSYDCCTTDLGKSGSMLLAFNSNMQRKILGFQVIVQASTSKAFAECPTVEQMEEAFLALDPTDVFPTSEEHQENCFYSHPEVIPSMIDQEAKGNFDFGGLYQTTLGAIKKVYDTPSGETKRKQCSAPARSQIRPTPMNGAVYPCTKRPAILNRFDPRWVQKMKLQCTEEISMETSKKWLHHLPEFKKETSDLARDFFIAQMRFMQKKMEWKPRLFTVEETVTGVEGTHVTGMKMGTASGVPYSHFYAMKGKNPTDDKSHPMNDQGESWFYQDESGRWRMTPGTVFTWYVEQYVEMAKRGEQMEIIWQNSNKDETLPTKTKTYVGCKTCANAFVERLCKKHDKLETAAALSEKVLKACQEAGTHEVQTWTEEHLKDTRIFTLPPMHYYSVFWMYFGSFMDFVMSAKFDLFCACGMNKYGPDFTELYTRMSSFSPYTISMDHSKYDSRMKARLMDDVRLIAEVFYGDSSEDDIRVRRCIVDQMIHSYMLSGTTVFQKHAGNPSGSPMTTVMNSIVNFLYMACCFIELARENGKEHLISLEGMMQSLRMCCYGDDIVVAIKEDIVPWFNFHTIVNFFGKYGMEVSHPSGKPNEEVCDVDPITEMQFLGNVFVRHPVYSSVIIPQLQWTSILDQLNWFKGTIRTDEQFYENIQDALYQIHFYGKDEFQRHKDAINTWLFENNYREVTHTYEAFDAFFLRAYGIQSLFLTSDVAIIGNSRSGDHEFIGVMEAYANAFDVAQPVPNLQDKSLLIIGGGDGTVNSIINGLSTEEHRVPKLHLPLGTGCDIARGFGFTPDDTLENLDLSDARDTDVDMWSISGNGMAVKFLAFCAIGRDAQVAFDFGEKRSEDQTRGANIRAMATISLGTALHRNVELVVDGEKMSAFSFLWQNTKFYGVGSTPLQDEIDPTDGFLNFAPLKRRDLLSGIAGTPQRQSVRVASSVIEVVAPTFINVDGEAFGLPVGVYHLEHCGTTKFVVRDFVQPLRRHNLIGRAINLKRRLVN